MAAAMPKHKLLDKFRPAREKHEDGADASLWEYEEEPHASRRREILKAHPEIGKLWKNDPTVAFVALGLVAAQIGLAKLMTRASWPLLIVCSYVLGGTLNQSLVCAIHEISHNLVFGPTRHFSNRALGIWCNLPLFLPISVTYKRYHADHHRYVGNEALDVDIPSRLEIKYVRSSVAKFVWLFFHSIIQGIRPYFKAPKIWSGLEFLNFLVQLCFDCLVYKFFGIKACVYLALGTFLGCGAHPLAAHFFAEHHLYFKSMATMSYYGPLNFFLFNIGYHNEHHDFPNLPFTALPEVKRLAPEFYDHLPHHRSWLRVLWDFVFDPNMGPHAHGVGYLSADLKPVHKEEVFSAVVYAEGTDGCFYDDDRAVKPTGTTADSEGSTVGSPAARKKEL